MRLLERVMDRSGEDADRLGRLVDDLSAQGLDPSRAVPLLAPLVGLPATPEYPAPAMDPSALLDETLRLLVDWLAAAAARRGPHLFVVEDVHWADPSTLELLGRIAERRPPGILMVATSRDETLVPWRDAADVVELGRLDGLAAQRLVDNLTAGRRLDDAARAV